ncbi:purine and uridine phosphorylase [Colletotrichum sublineola]|nr:purine and uridine phosphorylase [Colletotrichum sublineola]
MQSQPLIETVPRQRRGSSSESGTSSDVDLVESYNDNNSYTVGWVCTTNTDHLASRAFLENVYTERRSISKNDHFNCTFGSVGEHKVVIVCLRSGETVITNITDSTFCEIFPKLSAILVVGTGAGVPFTRHDVRLGDIVVGACSSSSIGGVIDYDILSKPDGFEPKYIKYYGDIVPPVSLLQLAVEQLNNHHVFNGTCFDQSIRETIEKHPTLLDTYKRPKSNKDQTVVGPQSNRLFQGSHANSSFSEATNRYTPPRRDPEKEPKVRYGTIASSSQPLKRSSIRDTIAQEKKNVLCFDVGTAAKGEVPRLVIRGICHYADSSDDYQWEGYATMAAAAYAKDFLKYNPPKQLREEPVGREFSGSSASATGISR